MDKDTCERIKEMSEYLDEESIADEFNVPVEVIRKVINGQLDVSENSAPCGSATRIQVVERPRFIRNRTVAAVSPGGGKGVTTLLTSLAILAALHSPGRRPVVIADFSEFPKAATMLGLKLVESLVKNDEIFPTSLNWPDEGNIDQREVLELHTIHHGQIQNLHILPGSLVADDAPDYKKMINIVRVLQKNFEMVFVDLPRNPGSLLSLCDALLVVLTADYLSLEGFFQLMPILERCSVQDRVVPAINRLSVNTMNPEQCRRILKSSFGIEIEFEGFIPEEPVLHKGIEKGASPYLLAEHGSKFAQEVKQLLHLLCPDWGLGKKQDSGGVTGLLKRLIGS